jgi:hypothetical protein
MNVMDIAQRFAASPWAESWTLFGTKIRRAILDSVIMDELRIAGSVDSSIEFTARDVIRVRSELEQVLRDGIRAKGSRRPPCAFDAGDGK